jgi:uncharacterized protein
MKIRLDSIHRGEHQLQHHINPRDLELDEEHFNHPITINMQWDRRDPYIRLRFDLSTHFQSICDRCLEDVDITLETQTNLVIQLRDQVPEDSDDPDFKIISPDDTEIDVTGDIRDAILLAVPIKILCSDRCKGLCPHCGTNLNLEQCNCPTTPDNPQWEQLRKLKNA